MTEAVIGAKTQDILHQKLTPEGSLTVTRNRRDILANTVGHVMAIPMTHLLYGTVRNIFETPSPEVATTLFERWKDVPWKGHVLVRVGHTSAFGDLVRAWKVDKLGGPFAVEKTDRWYAKLGKYLFRVFGIPMSFVIALQAKLLRSNYYNALANTANVYHPHLGFGMHEIGHADFFHHEKHKTAYAAFGGFPIIKSFTEYKASHRALLHAASDAERRKLLNVLEPAWATYLVRDVLQLAAIAVPTGLAVAMLNGVLPIAFGYGMLYSVLAAFAAGHVMNRLYPRKDQRFGYIFAGQPKEPRPSQLSAHQVLVAIAKAPKPNHTQSNSHRILF